MVYRTPAPRPREGAALWGRQRLSTRAIETLRRASRPRSLVSLGFVCAALVSAWGGFRSASLDEAKGYFALGCAFLLSAVCARHLWARAPRTGLLTGDDLGKKLAWSAALALPLLGPLFYGALYEPLPPNELPNRSLRWLGW
jgi:hypothetical protein